MSTTKSPNPESSTPGSNLRAAFVTLYDASDVNMMSGTGYNISQSFLRNGLGIEFIGPLERRLNPANIARYGLNKYLLRKNDHPQRDPGFLRHYARQVEARLREHDDIDVVFGSGGLPVSYLETDLPLVIWTDCTFANLLNYYGKYTNLSKRTVRNGHAADRNLYQRCERAIFASQWAADSAVHDYGLDPSRASIVSRGANVPTVADEEALEALIEKRPKDRCVLVLIGVDWERKGGSIAAQAARELNSRGIKTELRVIGVDPVFDGPAPEYVKPLGRISKSTPEGLARFTQELGEAHFLIVPTQAEAYGIVYLEASAYGVPSLATRTGGVPSAVREGVNGYLFDRDNKGAKYADTIERLMKDQGAYRELAVRAYRDHLSRTHWDVVGQKAISVLQLAAEANKSR